MLRSVSGYSRDNGNNVLADRPPSSCFATHSCSPTENTGISSGPTGPCPISQIFSLFESKVNCGYKMSKNADAFGKQRRPTVHCSKKSTHLRPAQLCLNHCQDPKSLFTLSCLYNTAAERKLSGLAETQLLQQEQCMVHSGCHYDQGSVARAMYSSVHSTSTLFPPACP